MNSLKSLFFVALLAAAACGVYVTLNSNPAASTPQSTMPSPKIDMGTALGGPPVAPSPGNGLSGIPDLAAQAPAMMPSSLAGSGAYVSAQGPGNLALPSSLGPPPSTVPDATLQLPPPPGVPAAPSATASSSAPPTSAFGQASLASHDGPTVDNRVKPADFAEPSASMGTPPADPRAFDLKSLKKKVNAKIKGNQYAEALTLLSLAYDNPDVSPNDQAYVVQMLDMLAGEVIYSRNHWLDKPYVVAPSDTLESIADYCKVPALLLLRINGLRNPQSLAAGTSLKIVRGPFSAQISVRRMELTLMLNGRYAGRFPVNLGSDPGHLTGMYTVRNKQTSYDMPVASREAMHGPGKPWIDLGDQTQAAHLSMQGTADLRLAGQGGGNSVVYLSDQDMDDLYGILSIGSSIVIKQ